MALHALLQGLGALALSLLVLSCGEKEWVCDNASGFSRTDNTNTIVCGVGWSCEGDQRFASVNLSIECKSVSGVFTCTCIEQDFTQPPDGETPAQKTFSATTESACQLSADSAALVNRECGWSVPEEDP